MKKTLYDILGIQSDATADDIARAYQEIADKLASANQQDTTTQIATREAYQVLSNPQRRAAYDASLAHRALPAAARSTFQEEAPRGGLSGRVVLIAGLIGVAGAAAWWLNKKPAQAPAAPPAPAIVMTTNAPSRGVTSNPAPAAVRSAEELYAELSGSIARINIFNAQGNQTAIGSGVVIGNGTVITNCHVTQGASQVQVKVGGESLAASVAVADEEFDLCRLSVTGLNAKPVQLGSVGSLRVGQKVYAIGAPHGLDLTISEGIVSSLRNVEEGTLIQTTAPISPGSSGGGLFDNSGQLVGIVTFQHRYGQNLNFAVPVDWIAGMRARSGQLVQASAEPAGKTPETPADKLLGSWQCFSPVTGRSLEMTFQKNRRVTGSMEGTPLAGSYDFTGKVLQLYGGTHVIGTVEDLSDSKFIYTIGAGKRLACSRK